MTVDPSTSRSTSIAAPMAPRFVRVKVGVTVRVVYCTSQSAEKN